MSEIEIVLIEIAVILMLARALGLLMRLVGQPQVVGEMIAGILLGPSALGLIHHGAWMRALFPSQMMGILQVLAQLGVMLFMFLVGLELDPKLLRGQGKAAIITGVAGTTVPFLGGCVLTLGLIRWAPSVTGNVPSPLALCMFMGTAVCMTALPVLARILTERNLHKTKSGTLALTSAAVNDVLGWCVLAFALATAKMQGFGAEGQGHASSAHAAALGAGRTVVLAGVYIALMLLVTRKFLFRLGAHFDSRGYLSQGVVAIIFLLLIASSLATDMIGIHQIFGAFVLGAVMPKDGRFIRHLADKIEDFTLLFLLPLFFAYTGLRTELGLLASPHLWLLCAVVIAFAVCVMFGSVALSARFQGFDWRQSALLGVLMNTRGLMELIILNIALTFGILSKPLFAIMVVMALSTTFMTTPLLRLLYSPRRQKEDFDQAAREEALTVAGMHVVVCVSLESSAAALVRVGELLLAGQPGRLYALHLERPEELSGGGAYYESDRVLAVARQAAEPMGVSLNTISYVTRNIADDVSDAAKRYQASWVVMGWHKPLFFRNMLGGVVGKVLGQAPSNVAIVVDKGLGTVRRVLVPYLGIPQDRGALLAADRLGRRSEVTVTILHVVRPNRDATEARLGLKTLLDKEAPGGVARGTIRLQVIETDDPIEAVIEESRRHDLLILGLSEEWQLSADAIFTRGENVAQRSMCSVLIAHANPKAPVVRPPPPTATDLAASAVPAQAAST